MRYELFPKKVKGIKFSHRLRQGKGPSAQPPTIEAPSAPRLPQYKPNESFLDSRKKAMPWYTLASTSVSAEDTESITDYINSGGISNDLRVVTMYIMKLMDVETLKLFTPALTIAIEERAPHYARTIVEHSALLSWEGSHAVLASQRSSKDSGQVMPWGQEGRTQSPSQRH